MGDIIELKDANIEHFHNPYNIKVRHNIESLNGSKDVLEFSSTLLLNLRELTIYLNNQCELNCTTCQTSYKQFTHCTKFPNLNSEISIKMLDKLIQEINHVNLKKINLLGGCILQYSDLNPLKKILSQYADICEYSIFYKNIINNNKKLKKLNPNSLINVLFDNCVNELIIKSTLDIIKNLHIKYRFTFIIQDDTAIDLINNSDLLNNQVDINILPYYNNTNLQLFEQNVFINKTDIFTNKPNIKQIAINKILNQNEFGKLTILSNGDVYANLNNMSIGNINNSTIKDIITNEMESQNSWFKTREQVIPCKNCTYCLLCPPISNYEYVFGKNNLCNIWENTYKKVLKKKTVN
jgi:pseudo-rSAM protein